jgi:hypothetical protein
MVSATSPLGVVVDTPGTVVGSAANAGGAITAIIPNAALSDKGTADRSCMRR